MRKQCRIDDQVFAMVLGQLITHMRGRNGLKQSDLAARSGVSQPVISRIEGGRQQPTISQFQHLARGLGLDVASLTARVNEALSRTRRAAEAATQQPAATAEEAWNLAFAAAGVPGLTGLVGFAVAAVLSNEEKPATTPERAAPPTA